MSDTILMKVGDGSKIAGETLITGYDKCLEVLSYSHSVAMQMTPHVSNTKRTAGTAQIGEFTITKVLDATTPKWNQYCCEATVLGDIIITLVQNDGAAVIEMMKYTLSDALVANVSVGGGGGGMPHETISLSFSKIKWDYIVQKTAAAPGGAVPATWDLTKNAAA